MVYKITATGEGMESMNLTFKGVPDYRRWSRSMVDVREKTIVVPMLSVRSRVLYLVFTWIPLTKQLVRDWGNDFVPSDIAANIVVAREFLDQQPAPDRRMLGFLQEIRVAGKKIAEYLRYYDGLCAELHDALQHFDKTCYMCCAVLISLKNTLRYILLFVSSRYRSVVTWSK